MNNDVFATEQTPNANDVSVLEPATAAWMAVFSLAMGVFGLLTAEYLPASLLTPMAFDLGVSEALAGQAVTVTAVVAMFAGLSVPVLTRNFDRRVVLLAFTVLMIASNLLVALSSSLTVLLVMRILLGVALGGFWSMAAAVAMRLVPAMLVPRALSIIFSGIAVGTVVSVPLGSYLGGIYGWRSAFIAAAAVGGLTLLFQLFTLPRMAPRTMTRTTSVLRLLRRPGIGIGMLGCVLAHTGQYALFTYIRPALESVVHIDVNGLSLMLLGFGVANFVGTLLAGWLMERSLRATLVLMPALVGLAAFGMILLPVQGTGLMFLVALWGLAFGGVPVAWSNWVARAVPDQAETAGGMVVAAVQSSIAAGAALGGIMFGFGGVTGVFMIAGVVMLFAALVIALKVRVELPQHGATAAPVLHG
ncbi:purine ribonucleoside efflux pump NepI [Janthinobacterium sp. HH103]|uniref:MFS transporter n=1 Tax=unclassified Janthinobacterium TaxID=2610881 RepID=UPI000874DEB0|nr:MULTISPECIES: MFS transporter [unclassified Janthinobacterium]OEZ64655.1 purine ribonucleoside efflux pump NepI [Janthinobacterium sp. HH100]OEZ84085.1 purine ribonucleoside efflux pump NepI [Janthinobacterium sp. HH103]QOU74912.1 Purine ribonucleoside efflux pump NepI [Janthinobacterium sp. HH102]